MPQLQDLSDPPDAAPTGSVRLPDPSTTSGAPTTILGKVAAGDTAAFAELYDATAARVYGLALRILRDPAQAEEVALQSYLALWRRSAELDAHGCAAISWLLMTTHGSAVNRVRSAQASTNRAEKLLQQTVALTRPDPTQDVEHASLEASRVRAAMDQLSTVQRVALELAYLDGCTHSEVATRLGLPLGTAPSRIRHALIRLRNLLDRDERPNATQHNSASTDLSISQTHTTPERTDHSG